MTLPRFLKLGAILYFAAGLFHLLLGSGADALLDPDGAGQATIVASLDSQSRFYGTYFGVSGAMLWLCARDMQRNEPMLIILLVALFAGGVSRLVSIAATGLPSNLVLALMASELVMPPVLWFWLQRHRRSRSNGPAE